MGSNNFNDSEPSGVMELTRNIMIMSIIALFIIMIFVIFVRFFSKQRLQVTETTTTNNNCVCEQRGLDDSLLKTIPIIQFDPKSFEEGLECSVCLSEVKEGEKARILPECDHGFHMECIDMWFLSHTTCPICRNPIIDRSEITEEEQVSTVVLVAGDEAANLQCSNSEEASSSSSSSMVGTRKNEGRGDLVIDIPAQREGKEEEDEKTPVSCSGMRSLTRILSGSRRFNGGTVTS